MKIFINKQIKENLKFSSELILFIGLYNCYPKEPKHCYNSENKSRYFPLLEYYDKYIQYTNNITECDIIILPYKLRGFNNDTFLQELHILSLRYNKPLLCFYNDDNDKLLDLPNNIHIYRTSFYKKTKNINEYALPVFSPDYFKNHYLYNPLLTIGYCGHIMHGRKKYIKQLLKSDIQVNFILRKGFWAPGIEKTKARNQFYNNIKENIFIFCYRGAGNFSYRFYQILMMGRIPILINTDCVFPFNKYYKLEDLGIVINEKDIINNNIDIIKVIKNYYKVNKNNLLDIQKNNRIIWEKYFSPLGFCKHMSKHYSLI